MSVVAVSDCSRWLMLVTWLPVGRCTALLRSAPVSASVACSFYPFIQVAAKRKRSAVVFAAAGANTEASSRFVALQPLESRVHPACAQSWLLRAPLSHRCEHVYVWCARDRAMATSRRQRCSCQCTTLRSLNPGWWLPPRHRQLHCCRLLPPRRRLHHIQRHRRRVWCRHRAVGSRPPRTSKVCVWMCECVSLGPTARATQTQCLLLSCRKCK